MIISKRRLRRLVREACGLDPQQPAEAAPLAAPPAPDAEVPVPEDYQATRNFLDQNPDLFDMAIGSVMSAVGTGCERSTAQAIVDHMKDLLGSGQQQPEAMPLELPMMMPEGRRNISRRKLRRIIKEAMPAGGVPDVVGAVTGVRGEEHRQWLQWGDDSGLDAEYERDGQLVFYTMNQTIANDAEAKGAEVEKDNSGLFVLYTGVTK